VITDPPVGRGAALRAGWNYAAWGRPRREVETAVAPWYERGYAGGLVVRQKEPLGTSQQAVSSALPRVVTAA
jgi:hypothetical protein